MKELRDKKVIQGLLARIREKALSIDPPIKIMEVCGTHTMTIHRYGLKKILQDAGVEMLSGPGCPVCITPGEYHEAAIDLVTQRQNLILTSFGDMTRVPTEKSSLQKTVPAAGSRIKIVYSPEEALELARSQPEKEVIFFGVGFETTIPGIALTVKQAWKENLNNFSVLSAFWLIPPPLKTLVRAKDINIQGFLYPGHVSIIIGTAPYRFIARDYGIPGAVTGFEPGDILLSIINILDQHIKGEAAVANVYTRAVTASGNQKAQAFMREMLEKADAVWRGLGCIPQSGLKLRKKYSAYDTELKYGLSLSPEGKDLPGCRCGDVLKGKIIPSDCPLFGKKCNPDNPYGPCMVSFEGACLAHFKYK